MVNPVRLTFALILGLGLLSTNTRPLQAAIPLFSEEVLFTASSFSTASSSRSYSELENRAQQPPTTQKATVIRRLDFTQGIFFGALAFLVFLCLITGVWFGLSLIIYYGLFATCMGIFQFFEEGLFIDFTIYSTVFRSQNVPMIVWAAGWVSFLTFSARFFNAPEKKLNNPIPSRLPIILVGTASISSILLQKGWLGLVLPVVTGLPFLFIWLRNQTKHLHRSENGKLLPYFVGMLGLLIILLSYALGYQPASEESTHWRIGGMFLVFSSFNLAILSHFKQEIRSQYKELRWRMQYQRHPLPDVRLLTEFSQPTHETPQPKSTDEINRSPLLQERQFIGDTSIALRNDINLDATEVSYFSSEKHYVLFYFNDPSRQPLRIRATFSEVLELFTPRGFVQTHRSYAVNTNCIYRSLSTEIQLHNGVTVPVSRNYKVPKQWIKEEV